MTELLDQIEKRSSDLSEVSKGLRNRDKGGTVAALAELVVSVASGVPGVGKLASEAARWAFARSAYGRLEKVAAEIEAELEEEARQRKLAETISELVARSLVHLGQPHAAVEAVAGPRDPAFDDFRFDATEFVNVKTERVSAGATGVELGEPRGRRVEISQREVTGKGSVGVKL